MKKTFIFILFVLVISSVFAQKASIIIYFAGFGETQKYVYVIIGNTGDVPLTSIKVFIDGKEYETKQVRLSPKKTISDVLYLEPGEHLIEVKTPEGAYDSLNIDIPSALEKPSFPPERSFLERNKMLLGIAILVVIFVIIAWLIKEKPRLKLK